MTRDSAAPQPDLRPAPQPAPQPAGPVAEQLAAHLAAGEQAMGRGDHAAAARALQAAADLMPSDLTMARMAMVAWQTAGNRFRAREVLSRALRATDLSLLSDAAAYELGALCLDLGAPDLALDCLTVTARSRPGNPALLGAVAQLHQVAVVQADVRDPAVGGRGLDGGRRRAKVAVVDGVSQPRHRSGQVEGLVVDGRHAAPATTHRTST